MAKKDDKLTPEEIKAVGGSSTEAFERIDAANKLSGKKLQATSEEVAARKAAKAPKLSAEEKKAIRERRKSAAKKRSERVQAEADPSKPARTNVGPLSGQTVRTPNPKAPGKRLTAVTGETIRPATNPELKRGIPSRVVRDQEKPTQSAGPRLPRIGQIYKHSDGRMLRVSANNIEEVHADAKRTVLPEAGRDVMEQPGRPLPLPGPRGGLRQRVERNDSGNRPGLGVSHTMAKEHVDRALGHLDTMAASEHGSGPYRQAQKSFQVVHGEIGKKNMSKPIHTVLQLAHNHIDTKQSGTEKMLNATKEAVGARLREGKLAEQERAFRQMQNE
jgi:hypothetical protein